MVKLVKHEKRIVLDGGLVAEAGEALAATAEALMAKASDLNGGSVLEIMDQVLDSVGQMSIGPISEAAREGMATLGDVATADVDQVVVFVDGAVGDIELIRAGAQPGAEMHILDPNRDGLAQIAEVMAGRSGIGAVHIISHGGPGTLTLGNADVAFSALSDAQQTALIQIGQAMTANGDILVYGCDFAAGDAGAAAVRHIAAVTGADVAASVDRTGSAELGGDWDLELTQGLIESAIVLDHPTREQIRAVLSAVSDVTGANFGSDSTGNSLLSWIDASTLNLNQNDDVTTWSSVGRGGAEVFDTSTTIGGVGSAKSAPSYSTANNGSVVFTPVNGDALVMDLSDNGRLNSGDYDVFFVGIMDDLNSEGWARLVSFTSATTSSADPDDYSAGGGGLVALLAQGGNPNTERNIGVFKGALGAAVDIDDAVNAHIINSYGTGGGATQGVALDNGAAATFAQSAQTLNANRINLGGRYGSQQDGNSAITVNEMIVFDRKLSIAERAIVNNYLAEKWGITVSGTDLFSGTATLTGFNLKDGAGIGKGSDGSTVTSATTGGLTMTSGTFTADNGDYFMVGHNNGAASSAADATSDVGGTSVERVGRTWAGNMTDAAGQTGGTLSLSFDMNSFNTNVAKDGAAGDYRLVIDTNGDGSFGAGDTTVTASSANGSGVIGFSVSAADINGKNFSFGKLAGDAVAPVLDLDTGNAPATYTGTYGAGDIGAGVSLDDATNQATVTDASDIANIKINLASGFVDGAAETLKFGDNTNINLANAGNTVTATFAAVTYNVAIDGGGTNVTISRQDAGTMTTSDAQDVIRNLQYQNTNGATATTGSRVFGFTLTDSASSPNTSSAVTSTIVVDTVAPVLDLDVPNGSSSDYSVYANASGVASVSGVSLENTDQATVVEASDAVTQVVITVGGVTNGTSEKIRVGGMDFDLSGNTGVTVVTVNAVTYNVQVSNNGATVTITKEPSGNMTASQVQDVIRDLTYKNLAGGSVTDGTRTFQFAISDTGGNASTARTASVLVDTTAPVLNLDADATYATTVNGASAGTGVSVDDAGTVASVTEAGDAITQIVITASGVVDSGNERLVIGSTNFSLTANGGPSTVTVGGQSYSISVTNNGSTFTITKSSGTITAAQAAEVVQNIVYQNTTGTPTSGARAFAFVLTDSASNTSATATSTITVDTVAPNAPSIASVTDDQGSVTGTVSDGGRSDDTALVVRVSLAGTNAAVGDSLQLKNGGSALGSAVVLSNTDITNGYVDITTPALSNATTYAFNASLTDVAGNAGASSASHTVTIDTTAPSAPTISINDNALKKGETTTVTFTFAEAVTGFTNADVTAPNGTLGALSSSDGGLTWTGTFTPNDNIEDATNVFTVGTGYTDIAGNTGLGTTSGNYAIDTQAPAQAGTPDLTVGSDSGVNTDDITNVTLPTFTGTGGTNGDTVTIYSDGVAVGTGTVQPGGAWSVTVTTPLNDGVRNITASYTDPAGNEGAQSVALPVTIDTAATTPTATSVATQSSTPTVTGTVTLGAGESLSVVVNGVTYTVGGGNLTVGGGTWSLTIPPGDALPEASYTVTATVTDTAGNTASGTAQLVVDSTAPGAPVVGALAAGDTTVTGTAEPGATVQVTLPGGAIRTVTAGGNGAWTLTGVGPFTVNQTVVAKAIDAAGNESPTDSETAIQTNTAPTLGNNTGWSGAQGETGTLTATQLSVTDAESDPAAIVFTVTGAPGNGVLRLNGVAIGVAGTFTQADINAGRVQYVHSGNGSVADTFRFTASDGDGAVLGEQTFNLTIASPVVTTQPTPAPVVTPPPPVAPITTPPIVVDTGNDSLFEGDIGGDLRSDVQVAGAGGNQGPALGGGFGGGVDNGPLSPGGQGGVGGEVGSVFGNGGLGGIQPSAGPSGAGQAPIGDEGSPDTDIQRFANTASPEAQIGEGSFGDLGRDLGLGDGPDLNGDGGNDGLSDLNGNAGGPILFAQTQTGDFGVRAGDFFRVFTEAGDNGQDDGGFDGVFERNNPVSSTNGQGGAGQGQGAPGATGPQGQPGANPQGGEEEQFFVLPPELDGAGQPGQPGQEGQPPVPGEGDPETPPGQQPAPGPQGQNNGGVQA